MTVHSEAFKALLTLERYCKDRECDDCFLCLGKDHDSEGYCPFDTNFVCVKYIADDLHEELSERVHFLEELDVEKMERAE